MVGREPELALLRERLAEAASGHPQLATVVGEPGVGKSRLAAELIATADGFQVLSGRCLQYGEGITYWPIAEIVHQAAGIRDEHSREEALARVQALVAGGDAMVVAQALGMTDGQAGTNQIAAAIAALFESLAREHALLVLVDDIHWAEPALLELLVAVSAQVTAAPLLLLCLARPELIADASWEATVRLQPLEPRDATTLVGRLLGEAALPERLAERIADAAAGNPLFVEELVGMLIDERLLERRNGSWVAAPGLAEFAVPPTLRELLGARLDRMPSGERSALEHGAVEGQVFHRGAVGALSETNDEAELRERLNALVEKEFIRPAPADFADEAAYRFRHILIRDAAYEAVPKKVRAVLHERFADWVEARAGERVAEYDEILGYHLERAYGLRQELGPVADGDHALALRAGYHLGAAGNRAYTRRDAGAAVSLLLRASELLPKEDPRRLEMMERAGHLLLDAGELERGASIFGAALDEAAAAGNRSVAARLEMYAAWAKLLFDPRHGAAPMLAVGERLEPDLSAADDHMSLARLCDLRAYVYDLRRQSAEVEREAEKGIEHARLAGNRWHELELHWYLLWQLPQGPRPVEDAIRRCHELRERLSGDDAADAAFLESLAQLEAMRGGLDEARSLIAASIEIRDRLGLDVLTIKYALIALGMIELLAAETSAAESAFRQAYERARLSGHSEPESNAASLLVEVLLAQDRLAETEALVPTAQRAEGGDAVAPAVRSLSARAGVLGRRGDVSAAEALAREAVALTRGTDDLNLQGAALGRLAEVLAIAGRSADARTTGEAALEAYERKGNIVSAEAARTFLAKLDGP